MAANQRYIDIGANLTDPRFYGQYRGKRLHASDLTSVLRRARANGVTDVIITGLSLNESRKAIDLCRIHQQNDESKEYPRLFATVGCHPVRSSEVHRQGYIDDLTNLISQNQDLVVGYGEMGLDYDRLHLVDKATQLDAFERQLSSPGMISSQLPASTMPLPLFLHCRAAEEDFYDAIQRHRSKFVDGVVHSFTGSWQECERALSLGLYIGITGISLRTSDNLDVVKSIPLERLLIETDAPFGDIRPAHASYRLLGVTKRQRRSDPENFVEGSQVSCRNEPCNITDVYKVLAAIRCGQGSSVNSDQLAEIIYENTRKVFKNITQV